MFSLRVFLNLTLALAVFHRCILPAMAIEIVGKFQISMKLVYRFISLIFLGTRHTVKCRSKGEPDENGYHMNLCSECEVTRMLPHNYFPQYFNEIICQTGTTRNSLTGKNSSVQYHSTVIAHSAVQEQKLMVMLCVW